MDKETAHRLIEDTFNFPFDENKYNKFVKNLIDDLVINLNPQWNNNKGLPSEIITKVKRYRDFGNYVYENGEKISVVSVELLSESAVAKSRFLQRIFAKWYLENNNLSAILIGFFSSTNEDWRFSFIKLDYERNIDTKGKIKISKKLTPIKRYSYLVGKNEPNHTAKSQLAPLLFDNCKNPSINNLIDSFSVENVTNEFFIKYKKLFYKLTDELKKLKESDKNILKDFNEKLINENNFAKKILGQIVFLYFIQKKGWLGVKKNQNGKFNNWGTGSKKFLRNLFDKKYINYDNFFNDILEDFLYEGLGREHENDYYPKLNCKIPFLNGELFQPMNDYNWVETDILIKNETIELILNTFDMFNFTVNENDGIETEVAIDPEMLGQVFERMLPEDDRKEKGAHYTPREVVNYLCYSSITDYLFIKSKFSSHEKMKNFIIDIIFKKIGLAVDKEIIKIAEDLDSYLAEVKICDPAVGSGAFPVTMMNFVSNIRYFINKEILKNDKVSIYSLKKHFIEKSLHAVDIDSSAIDIAKLRLWLSLIIEENKFNKVEPLPNLDYKILQGNSLINSYNDIVISFKNNEPQQLSLGIDDNNLTISLELVAKKQIEYINSKHINKKRRLKKEIDNLIIDVFYNQIIDSDIFKNSIKTFNKEELKEYLIGYSIKDFFLWDLFFADVFFKSNGFDIIIGNPPYVDSEKMTQETPELRKKYTSIYKSAKGNWDLFIIFIELGLNLLKKNGVLSFIVKNTLVSSSYAKTIKNILSQYNIKEIRDYSNINVFKEADVYPVTFRIVKSSSNKNDVSMVTMKDIDKIERSNLIKKNIFYNNLNWDFYFGNKISIGIIEKMLDNKKLSNIQLCKILPACTTGEAYEIKKKIRDLNNHNSKDFFKFINSGTIDPYKSLWGIKKTQYIKDQYMYPVINKNDLKIISKLRYDISVSEKIIIANMTKGLECFYDDGKINPGKSTTVILNGQTKFNLKVILAFLNSELINFFILKYFNSLKMSGGFINFGVEQIKQIPFPDKIHNYEEIIKNVDFVINNQDKDDENTIAKNKINKLVYKSFDINDEEIDEIKKELFN